MPVPPLDKADKKRIAVHAAVGAVIAIPLPIVGPLAGALVGGGLGYLKSKKKG